MPNFKSFLLSVCLRSQLVVGCSFIFIACDNEDALVTTETLLFETWKGALSKDGSSFLYFWGGGTRTLRQEGILGTTGPLVPIIPQTHLFSGGGEQEINELLTDDYFHSFESDDYFIVWQPKGMKIENQKGGTLTWIDRSDWQNQWSYTTDEELRYMRPLRTGRNLFLLPEPGWSHRSKDIAYSVLSLIDNEVIKSSEPSTHAYTYSHCVFDSGVIRVYNAIDAPEYTRIERVSFDIESQTWVREISEHAGLFDPSSLTCSTSGAILGLSFIENEESAQTHDYIFNFSSAALTSLGSMKILRFSNDDNYALVRPSLGQAFESEVFLERLDLNSLSRYPLPFVFSRCLIDSEHLGGGGSWGGDLPMLHNLMACSSPLSFTQSVWKKTEESDNVIGQRAEDACEGSSYSYREASVCLSDEHFVYPLVDWVELEIIKGSADCEYFLDRGTEIICLTQEGKIKSSSSSFSLSIGSYNGEVSEVRQLVDVSKNSAIIQSYKSQWPYHVSLDSGELTHLVPEESR